MASSLRLLLIRSNVHWSVLLDCIKRRRGPSLLHRYYSSSEHSADVRNYCGNIRLYSHPPTTDWIGFIIDSRARCPPTSEAQLTNCMLRLHVLSCACMHACMSRDRCEHVDARIIDVRRLERFFFVVNVGFIQYSRALLFVCLLA